MSLERHRSRQNFGWSSSSTVTPPLLATFVSRLHSHRYSPEISVQLVAKNMADTRLVARSTKATVALAGASVVVNSSIAHLALTSVPPGKTGQTAMFVSLLETRTDKFANLSYTSYSRDALNYPGYDIAVKAQVFPVNIVYIPDAVMEILGFSKVMDRTQDALDRTIRNVERQLDINQEPLTWREQITKVHVDVTFEEPTIAVVQSRQNTDSLVIDMKKFRAVNRFYGVGGGQSEIDGLVFSLTLHSPPPLC